MKFKILFTLLFSIVFYSQEKKSFYFDFNQSKFNASQLENVQNWIKENPNAEIVRIEGFCDLVGNDDYNDNLSYKRINEFYEIIKEDIYVSENLEKKGFGKKFEQNEVQDLNRRVDVFYEVRDEEVLSNQLIKKINLDSIVKQSKVGEKIRLKNIYFYNNSGIFVPKSKPVLVELLQVMIENPNLKIEIHGHICCQPVTPNEQVSRIRALAVCDYLYKNGIEKNRLSYKSFGSSQPIHKIPEKNEDERNENRRVEILILEK